MDPAQPYFPRALPFLGFRERWVGPEIGILLLLGTHGRGVGERKESRVISLDPCYERNPRFAFAFLVMLLGDTRYKD